MERIVPRPRGRRVRSRQLRVGGAVRLELNPPGRIVNRTHGTSYAVAHLAGIAATTSRRRSSTCSAHPGVCVRPPGWDDDWGVGRIGAAALLAAPLPDPAVVGGVGAFAAGGTDDPVSRLVSLTNTDPERVRDRLAERLGPDDIDTRTRRFEGELAYLLLEDPSFLAGLVAPGFGAFLAAPPVAASPTLLAVLAR